jgi:hypothetical protein
MIGQSRCPDLFMALSVKIGRSRGEAPAEPEVGQLFRKARGEPPPTDDERGSSKASGN